MHRCAIALTIVLTAALVAGESRADEPILDARDKKIVLVGFDALGMDEERVARLESLFRAELERLSGKLIKSRRHIADLPRRVRSCDGANACLARIGAALSSDLVVSGNVASLGDSYVVNVKVVDVASAEELGRIASDPLRGNPDELIEAIRVAAYRLLAPGQLSGALAVLVDREGARVSLDGKDIGTSPLPGPLTDLSLGNHTLRVTSGGHQPFEELIRVRFQKTSRVVVRLADAETAPVPGAAEPPIVLRRDAEPAWYQSTWFFVGVGVAAAGFGAYVGYQLAQPDVVNCSESGTMCQ